MNINNPRKAYSMDTIKKDLETLRLLLYLLGIGVFLKRLQTLHHDM